VDREAKHLMGKLTLDKSAPRIRSMFDRIAPAYDFLNHFLSAGIDIWWRRMAVRGLPKKNGIFVLDVATGTGDFAFSLFKYQPGAIIIGVDLAPAMLKKATLKYKNKSKGMQQYHAVQGDALKLPIKPHSLDVVMIAYGIRNVPDVDEALQEFQRVLKPGGHVLILEFSLPAKGPGRQLYLLYFNHILPILGGLISGDKNAYKYLTESVHDFIGPEDMGHALVEAGFSIIKSHLLIGGITYYILAQKREV